MILLSIGVYYDPTTTVSSPTTMTYAAAGVAAAAEAEAPPPSDGERVTRRELRAQSVAAAASCARSAFSRLGLCELSGKRT